MNRIINIKVSNVIYYLQEDEALKLDMDIVEKCIDEKKPFVFENGFSDPRLKNKTTIEVHQNLLRRIFDKINTEIDFLNENDEHEAYLEQEEFLENQKTSLELDKQLKLEMDADQEKRYEDMKKNVSPDEIRHIKKVQEQIAEKIKLNEIQEAAKARIKNAYNYTVKTYECENGIIMDGLLSDAENIEKAINFLEDNGEDFIILNDYENNDHQKTFDEAKQMVKEIKNHFYNTRNKKQALYNKIKETTKEQDLFKIRFN